MNKRAWEFLIEAQGLQGCRDALNYFKRNHTHFTASFYAQNNPYVLVLLRGLGQVLSWGKGGIGKPYCGIHVDATWIQTSLTSTSLNALVTPNHQSFSLSRPPQTCWNYWTIPASHHAVKDQAICPLMSHWKSFTPSLYQKRPNQRLFLVK